MHLLSISIFPENINPLNPHDASKHHFASLKNDLIYTWRFWNEHFHATFQIITIYIFLHFPLTPRHLYPLQAMNCDSNSQLVVDEDDNGKFRLERVKALKYFVYRPRDH